MELGERIATLRDEQTITQAELAERARISPSTLSLIESGKVPRPHVGTIRKIARALGVEPQDLRRTEELAHPLAEAPEAALFDSEAFEGWLEKHGAQRILMSGEQIREKCEQLSAGHDREAIANRFLQEMTNTEEEHVKVRDALRKELAQGGDLLPVTRGDMKEERARGTEFRRYRQELSSKYKRYLKNLEYCQLDLFDKGKISNLTFTARNEQEAERKRAVLQARLEEAFEDLQGA